MEGPLVPLAVVSVAVLIAAVTDLRAFKIHNLLTLPLLVSGLAYHWYVGGSDGLLASSLGALFGFGVLFIFFLVGGVGGGDVKLLAGVGAWLGLFLTFWLFNAASIAAGLYALGLIVFNGRVRETWLRLRLMVHRLILLGRHLGPDLQVEEVTRQDNRRRHLIPFGAMMAIGMLVVLLVTQLRATP